MTDLIPCARETHSENKIKVGQVLVSRLTGHVAPSTRFDGWGQIRPVDDPANA